MTSAQLFSSGTGRFLARMCSTLVVLGALGASGCFLRPQLQKPIRLSSAHDGVQLWAVVPFANESGVSTVNTYRVADLFTQELQQVHGINTVPVNRVVAAMRASNIPSVATPAEAMQLIRTLEVDAIVVGTISAWDPYPPPTLGMAVQVFGAAAGNRGRDIDPRDLVRASHADVAIGELGPTGARAQAAGVFDSRNHQTLAWLQQYATGRTEPDGAYGTEIYLMDMQLYTQFVSFRLTHDLLAYEWSRRQPVEIASPR